jgi:hypothetical protein
MRIAAIGRQTLVFRRLARCRSLGRRIGSVRRERIGRVARLGREWRRRIHVDAFTIDPVGPWVRGLRGCDAAADEQLQQRDTWSSSRASLCACSRTENARQGTKFPDVRGGGGSTFRPDLHAAKSD